MVRYSFIIYYIHAAQKTQEGDSWQSSGMPGLHFYILQPMAGFCKRFFRADCRLPWPLRAVCYTRVHPCFSTANTHEGHITFHVPPVKVLYT
ncbi:hypothetical protein J2Z49_000298 [Desulfofundulus luciae]|uniref:Uncharacterized protein n=1 Tax=Desulfofundulus luciae TaxID=74702 RepID=A0ABU0AYV0_9FIRM|nr:hypothetical protein [Desulfofundulus luciae]